MKKFNPKIFRKELNNSGFSRKGLVQKLQKFEPRLSRATVWNWERGKSAPNSKHLLAICSVFSKEPNYFFGDER